MNQRSQSLERQVGFTDKVNPVSLLVPPAVVSAFAWISAANPVSLAAFAGSYAIMQCAWGSYLLWSKRRNGLPVFAIIASVYWIFFAAALFWGERRIFTGHFVPIGEEYVTEAVLMAFLAVVCLWVGMKAPWSAANTSRMPDLDERSASSWAYLRVVLVVTTSLSLYRPSIYWFGAGGRNVMTILTAMIPTVAFLLLLRNYWKGNGSPVDKPLLIAISLVHLVGGLASGWLGSVVSFGLTLGAFYIVIHRRIPWTAILLVIAATFFLQVGKNEFRSVYWAPDASDDPIERAQFWLNASASSWMESLQSGGNSASGQLASRTMERASLLAQVAHVLELTPSQVPYQGGQTYSYLAVTLIPRFIWPDKPTVSQANQYYQVAYGLTDARRLESVSIAVGSMAEGYINFGWFGVIGIMLGIGVLFRGYQNFCTSDQANGLVLAITVALLPQLITIESQLGQYIAGLLQQIILTFLVFLPVTQRKFKTAAPVTGLSVSPSRVRGTASF